jgi:hypothetical protein
MRRKDELKVEVVVPAAQALREEIREEVSEVREQLSKQAGRLRELEERRLAEPGTPSCCGSILFRLLISLFRRCVLHDRRVVTQR